MVFPLRYASGRRVNLDPSREVQIASRRWTFIQASQPARTPL